MFNCGCGRVPHTNIHASYSLQKGRNTTHGELFSYGCEPVPHSNIHAYLRLTRARRLQNKKDGANTQKKHTQTARKSLVLSIFRYSFAKYTLAALRRPALAHPRPGILKIDGRSGKTEDDQNCRGSLSCSV